MSVRQIAQHLLFWTCVAIILYALLGPWGFAVLFVVYVLFQLAIN